MLPVSAKEIESSSLVTDQISQRFSYDEIRSATRNFNEALVIGCGGFGKVYKGDIKNGSTSTFVVAIKRSTSLASQGAPEFRTEIEMLSKIRHCNLVSLIGYCNEGQEMALVYEYMPHGTLHEHLHKTAACLSWLQRIKICLGAARGLDYLHTGTGTRYGIIHRDVKSSNILLDENFEAKLSDFGLAKVGPTNQTRMYVNTGVKGTFGYMDPCYFYSGKLTRKSDVYSFGVVLLEVMCGRPAVDSLLKEDQWGLAPWAQGRIKEGKLNHIIDSRIKGQISNKCMKNFAHLAGRCLHSNPDKRPTMAEIVSRLEIILSLQQTWNTSETKLIFIQKLLLFFQIKHESKPNTLISDATTCTESEPNDKTGNVISSQGSPIGDLESFSFNELKKATRNFRRGTILLKDHSTSVFKGWIDEASLAAAKPGASTAVAVKKFNIQSSQDHEQWLAQLSYLRVLSHPNIVKLIGFCIENDDRLLVYEFMSRGSLEGQLFRRGGYFESLSWDRRIKVALGAAKGLAYLHSSEANVICCDFKSSCILIDHNYNAKLSNFRLAKDCPVDGKTHASVEGIGTIGYTSPEYAATGHLTIRSNIYSFGVVLLEILTGSRCHDTERPYKKQILTDFVKPYVKRKREILHIMDPRIEGQYTLDVAMKAFTLASKCLLEEPMHRPTADEVVNALEQIQTLS